MSDQIIEIANEIIYFVKPSIPVGIVGQSPELSEMLYWLLTLYLNLKNFGNLFSVEWEIIHNLQLRIWQEMKGEYNIKTFKTYQDTLCNYFKNI